MPRFATGPELVDMLSQSGQTLSSKDQSALLIEFSHQATDAQIELCLKHLNSILAPLDFVGAAGVVACGVAYGKGNPSWATSIRSATIHGSLRVRDAAVLALVQCGRVSTKKLLELVASWDDTSLIEDRCISMGISDLELMSDESFVAEVLNILDRVLENLERERNTKSEDFKNLKKTLAFTLANPVAALPESGKASFEAWMRTSSPDVRWILIESLKRNRLIQMDREWVEQQIEFLSSGE